MFTQPQYLSELPFNISSNSIIDLFIQEAQKNNYRIIEKGTTSVIAMLEDSSQITSSIKKLLCFYPEPNINGYTDDGQLCMVKLQIDTNQVKCIRILQVKGIIGNFNSNEKLVENYGALIDNLKGKNKNQQFNFKIINDASEFQALSNNNFAEYYNILEQQQALELNDNPYYLETTAFYMFHRIFCATNYGLGNKIAQFIVTVNQQVNYESITLDQLRYIVEGVGSFISKIVDTLFQSFNFGKQETRKIMPFCRLATEKFLYLRLNEKIFTKYCMFYQEQNNKWKIFKEKIKIQSSIDDLKQIYEINESFNEKSKFESAIAEVNQILIMNTPREKLRCFQITNAIIKALNASYYEQYHKLCFLFSDIDDPYSQINYLMDGGANLDKKFLQFIQVIKINGFKNCFDSVQEDFK